MADGAPLLENGLAHHASSVASSTSRHLPVLLAHPAGGLTSFPNPYDDEPEPGLLPTILSTLRQTFGGASAPVAAAPSSQSAGPYPDRPHVSLSAGREGEAKTEAQQLAEAVKKTQAQSQVPPNRRPSAGPAANAELLSIRIPSDTSSSRPSPSGSHPSQASVWSERPSVTPLRLPQSTAPSRAPIVPSSGLSDGRRRKLLSPIERQWKPSQAAPAQVTISPVTSVTTNVQSFRMDEDMSTPMMPIALGRNKGQHHAHFYQNPVSSTSRIDLLHTAHNNAMALASAGAYRPRRGSIATIAQSPSSASLTTMITQTQDGSQASPYDDDTRSIRSGRVSRRHSGLTKIIRRIRGEGLSKQYWMADENCKECYDCRSPFSTFRRKHHCRICGQIFCSRCASNIIPARRFGQEGAIRVCNLCFRIMQEWRDVDDDDRRSIRSMNSARLGHSHNRAEGEDMLVSDLGYSQSPFAASHLFGHFPAMQNGLGAIDEGSIRDWPLSAATVDLARPSSPGEAGSQNSDTEENAPVSRPHTAAPFRRPVDDAATPVSEQPGADQPDARRGSVSPPLLSPAVTRNGRAELIRYPSRSGRVGFPRTETMSTEGGGGWEARVPLTRVDSNQPLIGLRTRLSSRASQGGLAALIDPERGEGLWRARTNSFNAKPEMLGGCSLEHFDVMLEQCIARADLPRPKEWHRALKRMLLRVATDLRPDVPSGDSMDVREYVKFKKVPGGKVSDSEYIDGVIITKNVAHKTMPRRLINPRIMLVTFPLDYHRIDNQFMSLEPILSQERDYLRLLTKRIIDLRPHIVLAERSVSRIALDYLQQANIAVARNVKITALQHVARTTQADIVASMDRLAVDPRLGRCSEFQVQTFEHALIPGGRKTIMRFEGCLKDQGCTLLLRGADTETLRRVKVVASFMALVAFHLRNEITQWNDEHNLLPIRPQLPADLQTFMDSAEELNSAPAKSQSPSISLPSGSSDPVESTELDEHTELDRQAKQTTREIAASLEPYLATALSMSVAVRFPPPAPLAKMAELDQTLEALRKLLEEQEIHQILEGENKTSGTVKPTTDGPTASQSSLLSPGTTWQAHPPSPLLGKEDVPSSAAMSAVPITAGPVKQQVARDPYKVLRNPEEVARESQVAQVEHEHREQYKIWQMYVRRHPEKLRAQDFQHLIYLFSLSAEGTDKPCIEPKVEQINFYSAEDCTVGQYLEALAADAGQPCSIKGCQRLRLFHYRLLVHGNRRLQIATDSFRCPLPGLEDRIIMWSYCRLCGTASPTTIMRDETWHFSWGCYLEQCFYPPEASDGFDCPHDAFRDHIRYFAHRNIAVRIHNEGIDLYEPIRPAITIQHRAEAKILLKNQEYETTLHKTAAFFDSVLGRLRNIDVDIVQPEKAMSLKSAVEVMLARAVADRDEIVTQLNRIYKLSPLSDVLSLNAVLRALQDKVVSWDTEFAEVEKAFTPSDKDLRLMTANHLRRLFANQDVFGALDRKVAPLTVNEVDEKDPHVMESSDGTPGGTQPPTPQATTNNIGLGLGLGLENETATTPDDENGVKDSSQTKDFPFGGHESDSTIAADQADVTAVLPAMPNPESSGLESDATPFMSRLPRRVRNGPNMLDLVQRFQDSAREFPFDPTKEPLLERSHSSQSLQRRRSRRKENEMSDSDGQIQVRPRLRRGRTEQPAQRYKDISRSLVSDSEKSYAANASRIPSTYGKSSMLSANVDLNQSHGRGRTPPLSSPSGRSQQLSPDISLRRPVLSRNPSSLSNDGKPKLAGKGKLPVRESLTGGPPGATATRSFLRKGMGSVNRVNSLAKHFDKLSREAEKKRSNRDAAQRGRRARPVAVTKAKVQVFSNYRDAFKDEFDSDSSEADNEEDDELGGESGDSGDEDRPVRGTRSPSKAPDGAMERPPLADRQGSLPLPITSSPNIQGDAQQSSTSDSLDTSSVPPPGSSVAGTSVISEVKPGTSVTERLKIDLPNFTTHAPLQSVPVTPNPSADMPSADESKHAPSQLSEGELSSGTERSSILKTLTGLWAMRAGDFAPLEYPLSASEHIFADSKVIIRESEPTSIIAFCLSSKTYRENLRAVQQKTQKDAEAFMPDDAASTVDRTSAWDVVTLDEAVEAEEGGKSEAATHFKYDFESGSSTIFCRLFFAEQFAALRSACSCEDSFVESLARCINFDASGGKSGSAFLKTKDDRFIAKEVSKLEMDALTRFAPAYFDYMRKAIQGQRPTALAKIYGIFKIGYRNAITNKSMRMNVLIMENLFYERRFSKIYDLKGSTRNRLIQATGRVNEVLLDENLMEVVYKHPIYLRDHAKRMLTSAIFNDTLFLSNLNVMDYSLVVGVDPNKHELVVGVVDYIRTFTWDKKLESWVKDTAFLGGAGKGEPTIVTPKQYKTRFRTAMERFYFPAVPDRWTKLVPDELDKDDEQAGRIL